MAKKKKTAKLSSRGRTLEEEILHANAIIYEISKSIIEHKGLPEEISRLTIYKEWFKIYQMMASMVFDSRFEGGAHANEGLCKVWEGIE